MQNLKTRWLGITIILDIMLTLTALILARWIRGYFPAGVYLDDGLALSYLDKPLYFSPVLLPVVAIIWLLTFSALSIYHSRFVVWQYQRTQPMVVAITGAVLMFAGVSYFAFPELSRFLFLYFYLLDLLFLVGWRKLTFQFLRKNTTKNIQPRHRVLIAGDGELATDVATAIDSFAWSGLRLVGFAGDAPNALGRLGDLPALAKTHAIDEVIFALPPEQHPLLRKLVLQLQPLSVNLRLVPDVVDLAFVRATVEDFAGLPLIGLREPAISAFDRLVKRSFDILAASALLALSLPVSLVTMALIKLDSPGAIFYTAQRVGESGKIFKMLKFRTMVDGANQRETDLFVRNGSSIGLKKERYDPRITRIGRILRRTSLDELPQLLNVIKGDMSLVGPRPELPWLVERYEPWQYVRFTVPQGMTGWWQVNHRAVQQAYNVRVEDDLFYIHNYSFLFDVRILLMTAWAIVRGDGAV